MLLSRSPSGPKKYFPIPVGHLEEEIRIRSADDCKRFREEFNVSLKPLCLTVWEGAGVRDVVFQDKLAPRLRTLASTVTLSPSEYQGNPLSTAVPCHYPHSRYERTRLKERFGPSLRLRRPKSHVLRSGETGTLLSQ